MWWRSGCSRIGATCSRGSTLALVLKTALEERLPGGACTHWKAPPLHGARQKRTKIAQAPFVESLHAGHPTNCPASQPIKPRTGMGAVSAEMTEPKPSSKIPGNGPGHIIVM